MNDYLTVRQVAASTGVSVSTVKRWIEQGLPKVQRGMGKILIPRKDLQQWLTPSNR